MAGPEAAGKSPSLVARKVNLSYRLGSAIDDRKGALRLHLNKKYTSERNLINDEMSDSGMTFGPMTWNPFESKTNITGQAEPTFSARLNLPQIKTFHYSM